MANENKPTSPGENTEFDVGTAADVEAIMKKYDRESNTRVFEGIPKKIIRYFFVAFSLFCIYVTLFANFMEQVRLSSFVGLIIIIGYLMRDIITIII